MTLVRIGSVAALTSVLVVSPSSASPPSPHPSCFLYDTELWCEDSATNLDVAPTAPVANTLARGNATMQVLTISRHLQQFFTPGANRQRFAQGQTGISAGEDGHSYGIWVSGSGSVIDNSEAANQFDGTSAFGTVGFDYQPNDFLVVGISVFTELTSLNTQYNIGEVDRQGYSLVPYAAYSFGQGTSVDAMLGLTYLTADVSRGGGLASGEYSGYRVMTAVNAHHNLALGAFNVRADIGYMYAHERQGSYTESGTNLAVGEEVTSLGQGKIGGRIGYGLAEAEPYVQAHYLRDFVRDDLSGLAGSPQRPENDRDEVLVAVGLDWFPTATESVGLEFSYGFLRDNESVATLLLNGRIHF